MPASIGTLKAAREEQKKVWADLDVLARGYGADVFRVLGQRYFKHQREQAALKREIAARERELQALQRKAAR